MSAVEGVAWTVYGLIVASLLFFSIGFTRYYQHRHETEPFATSVTVIALTLVLATLALMPVDIFLVSSTVDYNTGLKKSWANPDKIFWMTLTVQIVYYVCYGLIALFSFFVIPFAYFYYEEYDEGGTQRDRIASALKFTSFFVIISVLLVLIGLFVKPSHQPPKHNIEWLEKLLLESSGEKSISFAIACLFLLGMLVFITYTAPGLSILPFSMIKGRRRIKAESEEVNSRLTVNRERQRELQAKYTGTNKILSKRDQRALDDLSDEERILTRRRSAIEEEEKSWMQHILRLIRPFEVIIGFLLLALTLIVVVSIFLTIIDKMMFSVCGSKCGYIITHAKIFNPINFIFTALQKAFPLDYIFMTLLIVYFFLATMSGVITIGVRFLWVALFQIRKHATMPQGLLFTTVILTLGLLALNYSLTAVVTPGYAHFGSQVYCNYTEGGLRNCAGEHADKIVPCDIYAPTEICTPTIASILIDRMIVNTPFFGIAFYYAQWAFLIVFVFGFVIALFRKPRENTHVLVSDVDEDEEQEGLLERSVGHHRDRYGSRQRNAEAATSSI
ncbi:hypothetical protein BX666DRAFT_1904973 [Dichotomocladium elegans]|nr:hypothetical protein BX666DRAFT_1904973 [Dichotomocladium elegans]